MTAELKYVRHSTLGFVLWPRSDDLWHSDVGLMLTGRLGGHIHSAGFANMADGMVHCHGHSESLGICCDPDDNDVLAKQLGLETCAQKSAAIAPIIPLVSADTRRLDHLQARGATVELVNVATRGIELQFRVGGLHKSLSPDLRTAIDTSIDIRAAQTAQISLLDRPTNGE